MNIMGVIPARYRSSRFPGKPLADICGKPMIWWVYHQASQVAEFKNVYVATDDVRIESACKELGIPVLMTSERHPTGTDRVAEVAEKIGADLYINIQGDEPLLTPEVIQSAIRPFLKRDSRLWVSTLMTKIQKISDVSDVSVPKVAFNEKREAIFLSRCAVPYPKNAQAALYYKQVCVYGFRPEALRAFSSLKRGSIERIEDIELLRFIENDIKVQMVEVEHDTIAVDSHSDLDAVKAALKRSRI